jgi:hypothetical protein
LTGRYISVYTEEVFILKVIEKLKKHKVQYALVGGHAVSLHGAVRGTVDLDFIVKWELLNLERCELALQDLGLFSRHPIKAIDLFQFKDEYIKNKNLIAWNFINPNDPTEQVDIVITHDLAKQKIITINVAGKDINLISKADLIKMKLDSGRKQDLLDVEALRKIKS